MAATELTTAISDGVYRRAMQCSIIPTCLFTPDGCVVAVNPAMCEFLGHQARVLLGRHWRRLPSFAHIDRDPADVADLVAGRRDFCRTRKQYIHADGRLLWGDRSVSCLRNLKGEVETLIAQIVDVTDDVENCRQLERRLEQNSAWAEHLQSEMRSAAEYVTSILPGTLHGRVEVSSRYLPSLELGGDSYHYRWIDDDHLKIYMLDVAGHGVRPALLATSVHNLIRSRLLPKATLLEPDEMLATLNRLFQMEDHGGAYFTMWYGIYKESTRTLTFASAGHPPALAFTPSPDGDWHCTALTTPSSPVGVFDDTEFHTSTFTVPVGCRMVLFSDGAFEIPAPGGRHGSFREFRELVAGFAPSEDFSAGALADLLRARAPGGQFDDDCSLIALEFS